MTRSRPGRGSNRRRRRARTVKHTVPVATQASEYVTSIAKYQAVFWPALAATLKCFTRGASLRARPTQRRSTMPTDRRDFLKAAGAVGSFAAAGAAFAG